MARGPASISCLIGVGSDREIDTHARLTHVTREDGFKG